MFFTSLVGFCLAAVFSSNIQNCYSTESTESVDDIPRTITADHVELMKSRVPLIQNPFDEDASVLVVGCNLIESQKQFFGGNVYSGNLQTRWVSPDGTILQNRSDIPEIDYDGNDLRYRFPSSSDILSREQALKKQNRTVKSPFETDPSDTIYLNLVNPAPYDYAHLTGNIFDITSLPNNKRVHKILIQYLGDSVLGSNFSFFKWNWIKNLENMLFSGGLVFIEIRLSESMLPPNCNQRPDEYVFNTFLDASVYLPFYLKSFKTFPEYSADHIPIRFYPTAVLCLVKLDSEFSTLMHL